MYITKKNGAFSMSMITPEPVRHMRWQWIFFHPKHNPKHEHVSLFLLTEESYLRPIYDCYHFGADKARQFLGIAGSPLKSMQVIENGERVLITATIGEIAINEQEPDGYGSCYMQKCYEYSSVEYSKMKSEFEQGFGEMGWSR